MRGIIGIGPAAFRAGVQSVAMLCCVKKEQRSRPVAAAPDGFLVRSAGTSTNEQPAFFARARRSFQAAAPGNAARGERIS